MRDVQAALPDTLSGNTVAEAALTRDLGLTPTEIGAQSMPSSKPSREQRTRTPGVYLDSNGTYIVRIRAGGRNLKRRGIPSYAEAVELRKRLDAEPPADSAGVPTFADYFGVWRATYQGRSGRGVQPETL